MKEQILVIKLGALGDLFLALESFQALRTHHPAAELTLLTRPQFVGLARLMPWFDAVWADPKIKFWQLPTVWRFARQLRAARFRRVYDLQGNDRAQFYRQLGGWSPSQWVPAAMTEKAGRRMGLKPMPVAQRHRELLAAAGVAGTGAADLTWLDAPVAELDLPVRFVMLVPGCAPTRLYKRWPAGHFAAVGKELARRGITPVLIGTPAEAEAIAAVAAPLPEALNLCGRTSIPQLAAVARRAVGVIGNDTGPVHLTALVGSPTLVLMSGQSDPVRMKPLGPKVACLQAPTLAELPVARVLEVWLDLIAAPPQ
jgi:ADP-heptose:LPS heptosyltransferase